VVKLVRDAHFHGGQARFGLWDPAWGPGQADAADDDAG
jgi:predicted MPP superfamily phosphohydrolase